MAGAWRRGVIGALLVLSSCASETPLPEAREVSLPATSVQDEAGPSATDVDLPTISGDGEGGVTPTSEASGSLDADVGDGAEAVVIDVESPGVEFDDRLLGTNVPAWLGAERFQRQDFRDVLIASGATLIRMPGGSWSNSYDWLACEMGDADGCHWTWAARPSDFATLLSETGLAGMWTVSINETAQQSAALVAFFNGDVDDPRVIGVDRDGVDWGTVGDWATLRAQHGQPEPVEIGLWEVGNEVYAGKSENAGDDCSDFGWEDVWTCDGTTYVTGDSDHDGYLAIRGAMIAVDPTIRVGAVGIPDPSNWGGWGHDVVESAGSSLDFYVVHRYGFDSSQDATVIAEKPGRYWPPTLEALAQLLGPSVPIALTEHNLVAVPDRDTARTMTQASNAIFLAETIGQLALAGIPIANQWSFAGGVQPSGTSYGLVDADSLLPYPAFFAFALWGRFGDVMLPVAVPAGTESLGVYAGRRADGDLTVLVVNRTSEARSVPVGLSVGRPVRATVDTMTTNDPTSTEVTYNGVVGSSTAVLATPGTTIEPEGSTLLVDVPPWSVSLLQIVTDETG